MWLVVFRIVGWQIAVAGLGDAEHDARIHLLHGILDRRQQPVGERGIIGQMLLRIAARNGAELFVEHLRHRNIAARNRRLEGGADLLRRLQRQPHQRRVRGLDAAFGNELDQRLAQLQQTIDPRIGLPQIGRGKIDAMRQAGQLAQDRVAMDEIARRRLGDGIDFAIDGAESLVNAVDDALDLVGSLARLPGAFGGQSAFVDQIADLAGEIADDIADLARGFARFLGEVLHLAGDDGEAAAGNACPRRLDGGVQRQEIGLLGDALDGARDAGDLLEHGVDRAEPLLDTADGGDQLGDVAHRAADGGARGAHFLAGTSRNRLGRPGGAIDGAVGRRHRLRRPLQNLELVRLLTDAAGNFLQIARDVGDLDPERADPIAQFRNQTIGIDLRRPVPRDRQPLHLTHPGIPYGVQMTPLWLETGGF